MEEEPQVTPGSSTYSEVVNRNCTEGPAQGNPSSAHANTSHVNRANNTAGSHASAASPTINTTVDRSPETNTLTRPNTIQEQRQRVNPRSTRPAFETNPSRSLASNMQKKGGKILIIGDSILSGVNRKGLAHNIECQPYSGAKIETVYEKVQMFDLSNFSDIVIYVGGNDSSDDTDIELFEEKYDQLLQHIKNKTQTCEIHLCTSCPRGDTDVEVVNDVIKRLSTVHQVKCIDTNSGFYDKNHQLRTHFYKPRDSIHLSRSGIKRVLGLINETLYVVDNFEKCVYPAYYQQKKSTTSAALGSQRRQCQYEQRTGNDRDQNRNGRGRSSFHNQDNNNMGRQALMYGDHNGNQYSDNLRCLKCGLTNHDTDSCRHKTQVQCFNCKLYGHKDTSGLCRRI